MTQHISHWEQTDIIICAANGAENTDVQITDKTGWTAAERAEG